LLLIRSFGPSARQQLTVTVAPGGPIVIPQIGPTARPSGAWTSELIGNPINGIDPVQEALAFQMATDLLYVRSGRQWSINTLTVRPCGMQYQGDPYQWPWLQAYLSSDSQWSMWPRIWWGLEMNCGCGQGDCSCTELQKIDLALLPVIQVTEVLQDGAVLSPAAYRVDDYRWLVRIDGETWPYCQDMSVDVSQVNTWAVTFTYGRPPPVAGQVAVSELARQILLSFAGSPSCTLPQRVQSVARQGVTIQFVELQEYLASGLTGLPLVDLFLSTYNPQRLASRGRIYRADARPNGRQTGT
jgi:hypothetical protein